MSEYKNFGGEIRTSYYDSTPWWPEMVKASGPNVMYILIDDSGFADVGCFGALFDTPNIDALSADGLRFNNFHVNPMCSPTRASLLSGNYQHACGMGWLADYDIGFPGYRGTVKKECGLISETLVQNGYATFGVGKWHLQPMNYGSGAGPFDDWPLGRGFEKHYGYLSAETDQYYPKLVCGNETVEQPKMPEEGYHLSEDLTDHAIKYIGDLKSNAPDKPFFCYVAYGGHHSPHQAPKEFIDRYRGKFDGGWDKYREEVFAKQKKLGIVPENAELTIDNYLVKRWDTYSPEDQKRLARFMEVYAGFVTYTDYQIGRLVSYLKKIGQYDNTLIVFMHDNGASAEGGEFGAAHDMYHILMEEEPPKPTEEQLERLGLPGTAPHYPSGWANAGNTPFKLYKTWTHCGGMRVPCIMTYPNRIKDKGGIRSQYHHVVDINSTVLELCGVEQPEYIKGVQQQKKDGISMVYTFDDPKAEGQRHVQYYELSGNRGLWADGWKAIANHVENPTFDFSKDKWELYHVDEDFSENHDLAEQYPEKLRELQELWWQEAGKYNVLPMLESGFKHIKGFNSRVFKPRPAAVVNHLETYREVYSGSGPGNWIRRPFKASAYIQYRKGDEGVLFSQGEAVSGYTLYIQNDRPHFYYNWLGCHIFEIHPEKTLPEGRLEIVLNNVRNPETDQTLCTILVNGEVYGSTTIEGVRPLFYSQTNSFRVGQFKSSAVVPTLADRIPFAYSNEIEHVDFDFENLISEKDILSKIASDIHME